MVTGRVAGRPTQRSVNDATDMSLSSSPYSLELADYLAVVRRRWRIVLVLTCCGLLTGIVAIKLATKEYTATVSVYVTALEGADSQAAGGVPRPVNMDNAAHLVSSQQVAALAARRLRSPLAGSQLRSRVSVTVPANTTILKISCQAPKAGDAAACANAVAGAYLSVRVTDAVGLVSRQAHHTTLAGRVITPASAPASPSSPRPVLLLASGLLAGLVIGLLAAFLVDHRDQRLRTRRDVERFLGLPVVPSLPFVCMPETGQPGRSAVTAVPASLATERFTELGRFATAGLGEDGQVILVATADPGAGTGVSVVAAGLATALSQPGGDVWLTSTRPMAAPQLLGVAGGRGLSEVLAGHASVHEVAMPAADVEGLRVIGAGTAVSDQRLAPRHDAVFRLLAELRSSARYVVVETELVPQDPDAYSFAGLADAVILVIEESRTERGAAIECLDRLDRLATTVLCVAIVRPVPDDGRAAPPIAQDGPRRAAAPDPLAAQIPGRETTNPL